VKGAEETCGVKKKRRGEETRRAFACSLTNRAGNRIELAFTVFRFRDVMDPHRCLPVTHR